jgi:acyl-coenzyme A synthetase/AMP-(fatty) acid ligase
MRLGNGNDYDINRSFISRRTKPCPGNVAFIKDKEIWTFERLATQVDRLARGLIEQGVRKGDRVALHMANLPELVVVYHACFRKKGVFKIVTRQSEQGLRQLVQKRPGPSNSDVC